MIRRRLTNTKQSEGESAQPRRRRTSEISAPSLLSDERDLSDDDLTTAKLAESFRAERARVRDAIRRAIGNDLLSVVQEGLRNMSSKSRRRVQSRLDHLLARQ
jgi:hypothetical protein